MLSVLSKHEDGANAYGNQRLWGAVGWGACALTTGLMVDIYGLDYMFTAYTVGTVISIGVLFRYFPSKTRDPETGAVMQMSPSPPPRSRVREGSCAHLDGRRGTFIARM